MITIVRIPMGIVGTLFLLCIGWPAEFVLGVIAFPLKALTLTRPQLKMEYGVWPFNVFVMIVIVWHWVFLDVFLDEKAPEPYNYVVEEEPPEGPGKLWPGTETGTGLD
jgi:hypothetical protein